MLIVKLLNYRWYAQAPMSAIAYAKVFIAIRWQVSSRNIKKLSIWTNILSTDIIYWIKSVHICIKTLITRQNFL